jgi:predicted nucleotidyltransferase
MKTRPPQLNRTAIADFCKRHHIQKLSLFGSVLRSDFNDSSDLDVLVEFEATHITGLIGLAAMEHELTELVGRKVDLPTPQDLNGYFRDQVPAAASVQYAE